MQRAAVPQGRASSVDWRALAFARLPMRDGPGGLRDAPARAAMSHSRPGLARGPQRRARPGTRGGKKLDERLSRQEGRAPAGSGLGQERGRARADARSCAAVGRNAPIVESRNPNRISRCDRDRGVGRGQPCRPSNGARLRTWRRSRWWTLRLSFGAGITASRAITRTICDRPADGPGSCQALSARRRGWRVRARQTWPRTGHRSSSPHCALSSRVTGRCAAWARQCEQG